jgi:hypothetical protein
MWGWMWTNQILHDASNALSDVRAFDKDDSFFILDLARRTGV